MVFFCQLSGIFTETVHTSELLTQVRGNLPRGLWKDSWVLTLSRENLRKGRVVLPLGTGSRLERWSIGWQVGGPQFRSVEPRERQVL